MCDDRKNKQSENIRISCQMIEIYFNNVKDLLLDSKEAIKQIEITTDKEGRVTLNGAKKKSVN